MSLKSKVIIISLLLQLSISTPSVLPVVSQSNLKGVVSGVFVQDGDVLLDVRHLDATGLSGPLYWKLPPTFTGNKVASEQLLAALKILCSILKCFNCIASVTVLRRNAVLLGCFLRRGWRRFDQSGAPGANKRRDFAKTGHLHRYGSTY